MVLVSFGYSHPWLRWKERTFGALIAIAVGRGFLLTLFGYAIVRPPQFDVLPVCLTLYLFGATGTKDFADVEGDRKSGNPTLPIRYGTRTAISIIAPFIVGSWVLLGAGSIGFDDANPWTTVVLCSLLTAHSVYIVRLLQRPTTIAPGKNHPAWKHFNVLLMEGAVVSVALAWF
jgi:4-hydroxybenzoate polyprenyltransferase